MLDEKRERSNRTSLFLRANSAEEKVYFAFETSSQLTTVLRQSLKNSQKVSNEEKSASARDLGTADCHSGQCPTIAATTNVEIG